MGSKEVIPWTTKQHVWVMAQHNAGRKASEFWVEFEPLFGVARTRNAIYQYLKKVAIEEGTLTPHIRTDWSEEEISRLVKLHGVMKNPSIARLLGRTLASVEG